MIKSTYNNKNNIIKLNLATKNFVAKIKETVTKSIRCQIRDYFKK